MKAAPWTVLGASLLLVGCGVTALGPQRLDAIDEPLVLPVKATPVEVDEFYPTDREGTLVENQGRLYYLGGSRSELVSPTKWRSTRYYDVWMSEDGIRWSKLTDEIFLGANENQSGPIVFRYYSYDGYLWAMEVASRRELPDPPEGLRLFRSVDGIEWELASNDYEQSGFAGRIIATDDGIYQFDGLFPLDGGVKTRVVESSQNGTVWNAETYQDDQGILDYFFVPLTAIRSIPFAWDTQDNQIGRFDVDTLTWEALSIDPDTRAKLFLTEVTERSSRSGSAFVGHNGHLYLIGGSGLSIENPVITDWPAAEILNDVWRSPDGVTWERLGEQLPYTEEERRELGYRYNFDTFPGREDPQVVSWRGVLYLTGGVSGQVRWNGEWMFHSGQDAWVSRDGETWYELARVRGSHEAGVQAYQESREGFVVPGGGP